MTTGNTRTCEPRILTTTVGSYPIPHWLLTHGDEQAVRDATRVVVATQTLAGIDLPTDGELYRFDPNHPETNGMIEYFIRPLDGVRARVGRRDWTEFQQTRHMGFRTRPAGVVEGPIDEGGLNLLADCRRAVDVAGGNIKFTLTSPYMLARTLLDHHYGNFETLLDAIAQILARQVSDLPCRCIQVDEANITGNPSDAAMAAKAINTILDAFAGLKAVHLCFGNYGGQTIQQGHWRQLIEFVNSLRCDHLVLELAHRPESDLEALCDIDDRLGIGIGIVDVKVNHIETPDEIARRIEKAEKVLGQGRVRWVHPDCGFWMLHRSVADRKIHALVQGRDRYLSLL